MTCMECKKVWNPEDVEKEGKCPNCGCTLFDCKIEMGIKNKV